MSALRSRLRGRDGFTLVEMLVALTCALVVMFALTNIMIVTMHQSQDAFTRVDATREARTTLAKLENELHSACVNGSAPVQAGSDDNDLQFVSYFGNSTTPQATWHDVTYDSTAHTLVDNTQSASFVSNSSGGYWSATGSVTPVTLLTDVWTQPSTPVFQYFAYTHDTDPNGNEYWWVPDGNTPDPLNVQDTTAAPLSTPLSSSDAQNTVEVAINLLVGASAEDINNTNLTSTQGDAVTDTISLRLTTPPDYTPAGTTATGYGPCQ